MVRGRFILLIVALTAPSLAAAQTMSFSDGAAILAKSCAPDITANCRGVNIDSNRLKECLSRNQDMISAQCKARLPRAFERSETDRGARHRGPDAECESRQKCRARDGKSIKSLDCLLSGLPRPSERSGCSQSAIADVGARATDEVAPRSSSGLRNAARSWISAALRQQVVERSKSASKNEPPPQKRPPIAPELNKLPSFNVDIQFDVDTPIVRPEVLSDARAGSPMRW